MMKSAEKKFESKKLPDEEHSTKVDPTYLFLCTASELFYSLSLLASISLRNSNSHYPVNK